MSASRIGQPVAGPSPWQAAVSTRHDAGSRAEPYVGGTLLAVRRVEGVTGLVRGLDRLLFGHGGD